MSMKSLLVFRDLLYLFYHEQDILKFAVIFLVVFVAFLVGLHNLYWYYPKETRQFIEFIPNNITTSAEKAFGL